MIERLPRSAYEAYDQGLRRMAEEFPDVEEGELPCTAIQALFWVVYAKSPLTETQLRQALATKFGAQGYDPNREVFKGFSLTSICAEYLVVDNEDSTLRVAHKTIADDLLQPKTRTTWFPSIEEHIPTTLLQFLHFECLKRGNGGISRGDFISLYPLCPYALEFWGKDLARFLSPPKPEIPETTLWKMADTTLKESICGWNDYVNVQATKVLAAQLGGEPDQEGWPSEEWFAPGRINGLHWVVFLDLPVFIPILAEHDRERLDRDPIPTTPLGLASICKGESMMDDLITIGAQVNLSHDTDHIVLPPIFDAALCKNATMVSKLLKIGADPSVRRGTRDESPLDMAFWLGHEQVADILATNIHKNSPMSAQELLFLVRGGFVKQLECAIERGLGLNIPCENGKMALDYAKEMGNQGITELLIKGRAASKLTWPAVKTDSCPYPLNYQPAAVMTPIASGQRHWGELDCAKARYSSREKEESQNVLLLEVPVSGDVGLQVRRIVFETVSADQGFSNHYNGPPIYMGSLRSRVCVRMKQKHGTSQDFILQNNVHASHEVRLHTNIWNLSELEASFPAKAALMKTYWGAECTPSLGTRNWRTCMGVQSLLRTSPVVQV
ncbi:uncharacterized protein PG986_004581 [Apiospora aurea]|uniref:Uncharacterized protein n=1 Tax=Apiospora aurea TaxID=335848 RepID=A0ABR1QNH0_9PEZI